VPARRTSFAPLFAAFAAAFATALTTAACTQTESLAAGRTLQVALTEYRLRPDSVSSTSGALMIVAHNYGRLTHNLTISDGAGTVAGTKPIPPGGSATVCSSSSGPGAARSESVCSVTLAPGTYTMASTILSDEALGIYGTLKVAK
jgi:hypothetical protein